MSQVTTLSSTSSHSVVRTPILLNLGFGPLGDLIYLLIPFSTLPENMEVMQMASIDPVHLYHIEHGRLEETIFVLFWSTINFYLESRQCKHEEEGFKDKREDFLTQYIPALLVISSVLMIRS